jgi:hypothetical protein
MAIRKRALKGSVVIKGVTYIPVEEAAKMLGVTVLTMYRPKMKKDGPTAYHYLGVLLYEKSEVEQYKSKLLTKVSA